MQESHYEALSQKTEATNECPNGVMHKCSMSVNESDHK